LRSLLEVSAPRRQDTVILRQRPKLLLGKHFVGIDTCCRGRPTALDEGSGR
jgi:hypothetical protein